MACSVPASCIDGEWKVVTDMKLSEDMQVRWLSAHTDCEWILIYTFNIFKKLQISQQATALLMELNVASDKLK